VTVVERLLAALGNYRRSGSGYVARCPAHEDRRESLSIGEGSDGRALVKCFAGCDVCDVVDALGMSLADLMPASPRRIGDRDALPDGAGGWAQIEARYDYTSETGDRLHWNKRYAGKRFMQGRWAPNGPEILGLQCGWFVFERKKWRRLKSPSSHKRDEPLPAESGAQWFDAPRIVLYRLPSVVRAKEMGIPVYVCDGEKDVHAIEAAGGVATCRPKGRNAWAKAWTESLSGGSEGYRVVVVRDRDGAEKKFAGERVAAMIADALIGAGVEVSVVQARSGKDAHDHLSGGYTLGEFEAVPDWRDFEGGPPPVTTPSVGSGSGDDGGERGGVPRNPDGSWKPFALTDLGNAERLQYWHGDDLLYCHEMRAWLLWDGTRWVVDKSGGGSVKALAQKVVRGIGRELASDEFRGDREAYAKWMIRSEDARRLSAMVEVMQSFDGVRVRAEDLDRDGGIVVAQNGTVDLRTGRVRESRRSDMVTRCLGCRFDPDARTERWTAFLDRVLAGDLGLMQFLWRAGGYSLTGFTSEEKFFFLYGTGRNGKGTFVETISHVLGDYATSASAQTFMVQPGRAIQSDIARLDRVRFVSSPETSQGGRLDEELVKTITGGDRITARPIYKSEVTFLPQLKLWMSGNYHPRIRGTDEGIWSRVALVPFTQTISVAERDKNLKSALRDEAEGILAWLVAGAVAWFRDGLGAPTSVVERVEEYRREQDVLGRFFDECTEPSDGAVAGRVLYDAYAKWAKDSGEFRMSNRDFGMAVKQRGIPWARHGSAVRYKGLSLTGTLAETDRV